MPPSGFLSRNLAIGEFSPSGSSSSILVLGSVMNTVETPCSGCATFSDTSAPSVSLVDVCRLGDVACTAMAT